MSRKRQIFIVGTMVIGALALPPNAVLHAQETGLIGYWSFGEAEGDTAYDRSGEENHGLIDGAVRGPGIAGSGIEFDGLDGTIRISDADDLDLIGPFTISLWTRSLDVGPESLRQDLLSKERYNGIEDCDGYYIRKENDQSVIYFNLIHNGTQSVAFGVVDPSRWYHLVVTYDGSDTLTTFMDGRLMNKKGGVVPTAANTKKLCFGSGSNGSSRLFAGSLDEVRIYERALEVSEIEQLYDGPHRFDVDVVHHCCDWSALLMDLRPGTHTLTYEAGAWSPWAGGPEDPWRGILRRVEVPAISLSSNLGVGGAFATYEEAESAAVGSRLVFSTPDSLVTAYFYIDDGCTSGGLCSDNRGGLTLSIESDVRYPPGIASLVACQREGTKLVDVSYDLEDRDSPSLAISLWVSQDEGGTFPIECTTVTGDVGPGVPCGLGKHIVWDAGVDCPGFQDDSCVVRVVAEDE